MVVVKLGRRMEEIRGQSVVEASEGKRRGKRSSGSGGAWEMNFDLC